MSEGSEVQPASSQATAIRLEGISKRYDEGAHDDPWVLDSVSYGLESGRFAIIMGPSGSGKSTLLHIVAGLEEASRGKVWIGDRCLTEMKEKERTQLRRQRIGFVFQAYNLIPHLTVAQNLRLPLYLNQKMSVGQSDSYPKFDELSSFFSLDKVLNKRPHQLSGGEMQRTSIARALIAEPSLILADEPTGNISSKVGAQVMDLLRRSCDTFGQTILLVTHNPRDAAYADEVAFLRDGNLSEDVMLKDGPCDEARVVDCLAKLDI